MQDYNGPYMCYNSSYIRANIGIGTVITAFGTGPFVQFFNEHISKPWLHHKRRGRYAVRRTTEPIQ